MSPPDTPSIDSPAAKRWAAALASWGIPQPIMEAAPRDPWGMPVARFAGRADRAISDPSGLSFEEAAAALKGDPGAVLDVGAGAGAGSLPLASLATELTAVDNNEEMLQAYAERAKVTEVPYALVLGLWPAVASQVHVHDVVVAHHVVYNVPVVASFLRALTAHARRRVVLELPPRHPMTWMTPLWQRFHDISRPSSPTVDDLVAVLEELRVAGLVIRPWTRHDPAAADGSDSEDLADRATLVTQRLCLPPEREAEVADALVEMDNGYHREVVTVAWDGTG